MRKLFISLFLLVSALSVRAGQIVTDSIQSKTLGATVKYRLFLPDRFRQSTDKYPFVYLLHGFTDTYTAWTEKGHMREVVEELINSGEAANMVIVMPNAGGPDTRNEWNGYFDMPGWAYETFFFQEFLPEVEQKYRAIGDKQHRVVRGASCSFGKAFYIISE